jgi:zinc transport system permease protein
MALLASVFGMLAVSGGLFGSYRWDLPAGPAIVVTAALLFFFGPHWWRRRA